MKARFFGEYLVQKGVITPDALVSALIEQTSKLPLVSQLVYEHKLVPAEKLLEVFHVQQVKGEDFAGACRAVGIWTAALAEELEEQLQKLRIPVGQILVERGYLDLKTLTRSLDDFLAQAEVNAPEPEIAEVAVHIQATPDPVSESASTDDIVFDKSIISEVEDMFDERKRRAVKVAIGFIREKTPPDATQMTKLVQDALKIIRTILGLVKLMGLETLQVLLEDIERVLIARMHAGSFSIEEMQRAAEVIVTALDEAWALRNSYATHCTDGMYLRDKASKQRYDQVLLALREIK